MNDPKPTILSRRHRQVLALLAEGLQYKEIGARLNTSPRTIGNQIQTIMDRTGYRDRVLLARYAWRTGIAKLEGASK